MDSEKEKQKSVESKNKQSLVQDSKEHEATSSKGNLVWSILLLLTISLARIGNGLFISIHGPTLLTLANNVGASISEVSWLFSGRSLGLLVGGMATGPVMRKVDNMFGFGFTCLFLGGVTIGIPWITDLWLLVVVVMIGGISYGYLDAGMQALILQVWGEKDSRGLISGYHFMIAVGAFLAPIIAQPFLKQQEDGDVCPDHDMPPSVDSNLSISTYSTPIETTVTSQQDINPVVWAYLICGIILFVIFLIFTILGFCRLESKVRRTKAETIEIRKEDPIKDLLPLFALICVYYFFCVAGETSYNSYIYSVSVCSGLNFSTGDGTLINSLFWIGFGLGRLGGVVVLRYLTPTKVIIADLVGTIISMIVISIFGEYTAPVAWAITFFYGFFQATIYPAGVSWASQYTNMSGNYIFIFSAGQALGTMILVPVGGILFDINAFNVMYLVLGCSVCNAIVFICMMWAGKLLKQKREAEEENANCDSGTKL